MTSRKMGATATAVALALAASIVPVSAATEDLETVAHTTFTGSVARARLGETLAPAGDFDGDGFDDAVAGGRDEAVLLRGHVYPDMNAKWRAHGTAPYDWHLLLR